VSPFAVILIPQSEEKDLRSSPATLAGRRLKRTIEILRPPIRMADSE
jgi:hypothetical protein